ncbi:energy transducer TonB [Adhaeribacter radiodurans]|uniref:TonB family protein n=1 Tax=Adhaeribacter radiodurans TaxID=2745197 RepID=A0A7L7LAF2_9BACT|nr:energy transducer TonB [Adhaeribacter radiodurans]QMU29800.1 TonB family protein [Adhaeribacter radiodurans]
MKMQTNYFTLSWKQVNFTLFLSLASIMLLSGNAGANNFKTGFMGNTYSLKSKMLRKVPIFKQQVAPEDTVYKDVEQLPQFPGGLKKMYQFLANNIRHPGKSARVASDGTVIAKFIVTDQGKIKDLKIEQSINPQVDAETLRVIKLMPDWEAGKQNGKSVNVEYTLPIRFATQ